jgi:two-component system, cell cycle sensor histidine kinase and response regulator CckA
MSTDAQLLAEPMASILDRALRILHLEDNPDDRYIIQHWLKERIIAADITNVDNEADFVKAIEQSPFDIILADVSLRGFDGLAALHLARGKNPHIPFIFVTGSIGEEAAIETMREGATDYVLKGSLSRLIPAVQRAVRDSEQAEKTRQFEEKNRQQAALLDKAQDAILVTDVDGHILFWNKSAEKVYGWPAAAALGRKITELLPTDSVKYQEAKKVLMEKGGWTGELATANRGGNALIMESRWTLVRDERANPKTILVIDTDITEKKALETKFLRSQRMDSIGALAGGIAHDLNNALAPVIMGSELLRSCQGEADREKFLDIIHSNAHRATGLVKQILGFARGSEARSGPVQIRHLVREMGKMIQDTFPKSILFSVKMTGKDPWTVRGDTTEIHQVLLNLCVNARDAMPEGGQLTLSAENFTIDEKMAMATGAAPGPYVMISVADTGTGIPPEVLPRIFEPFFTTKKEGKGTGLGLATVAGIVKNHGGFMDIDTQAGKGTKFKVYFPAIESVDATEAESKEVVMPAGHGELIFLIDDEEILLEMTKTMLESFGYQVITARDGLQGVARFREYQDKIKLVITDSDMPHMDGKGVIRAIKELKPNIPIIIASGTKGNAEELGQNGFRHLKNLEKPYTLEQLLTSVDSGLHN